MEVEHVYPLRSILSLEPRYFTTFLSTLRLTPGATNDETRDKIAEALASRTRAGEADITLKRTLLTTYPYFVKLLDITRPGDPREVKLKHRLSTLGINPSPDRIELMNQVVNLLLTDPINYPVTRADDIEAVLGLMETSPITVPTLLGLAPEFEGSKDSGLEAVYGKLEARDDLRGYYLIFLSVPGKLIPLEAADVTADQLRNNIENIIVSAENIFRQHIASADMKDLADQIINFAKDMELNLVADARTAGLFVFLAKMTITSDGKAGNIVIQGDDTALNFDFRVWELFDVNEWHTTYPLHIGLGEEFKASVSKADQGIMIMYRYSLEKIKAIRSSAFNVNVNVNPLHTNRQLVEFNRYFTVE